MLFSVVLVEDEPLSRIFLRNLLIEFCPDVHVVATASTEEQAVELINHHNPDIILLDIELQQGSGLEVIKRIKNKSSQVIFTTAFDHHAVKAIQFSGIQYLQKPIDLVSLQAAISIAINRKQSGECVASEHLLTTMKNDNTPLCLAIQCGEKMEHLVIQHISQIYSQDAHLVIVAEGKSYPISNSDIKTYDELLKAHNFIRVHLNYLVNKTHIRSFDKKALVIVLSDGASIPVSAKKADELQMRIGKG
ncbi:MAG: response regulator transcription factor [Chitinophagaceae bacterium]|nr:response regulator transcription factor [Chitinophagaceae bacterium]